MIGHAGRRAGHDADQRRRISGRLGRLRNLSGLDWLPVGAGQGGRVGHRPVVGRLIGGDDHHRHPADVIAAP